MCADDKPPSSLIALSLFTLPSCSGAVWAGEHRRIMCGTRVLNTKDKCVSQLLFSRSLLLKLKVHVPGENAFIELES